MIKTIKVKKQLRLDELIKYIFDMGIEDEVFQSNGENICKVRVSGSGNIRMIGYINERATFAVEVEEEIDNTTIFKSVVGVLNNDEIMLTNMHTTIEGIQDKYGSMKEIYAVIDGKLQLIWEVE